MQEGKGGKAKAYQVQQLPKAIDRWQVERSKRAEEATTQAKAPTRAPGRAKRKKRK
jgi:hypothetical protein